MEGSALLPPPPRGNSDIFGLGYVPYDAVSCNTLPLADRCHNSSETFGCGRDRIGWDKLPEYYPVCHRMAGGILSFFLFFSLSFFLGGGELL